MPASLAAHPEHWFIGFNEGGAQEVCETLGEQVSHFKIPDLKAATE